MHQLPVYHLDVMERQIARQTAVIDHGQSLDALANRSQPRCPRQDTCVSCRWYTGHVTAGGSICIAALTLSGSANSWTPDYCVESILNVVIANMCAVTSRTPQATAHVCACGYHSDVTLGWCSIRAPPAL